MKIGIFYIALGVYDVFWFNFYKSFQQYFFPKESKTYFVFTDSPRISQSSNVHIIPSKYKGWIHATLMRYEKFLLLQNECQIFDYLYFFNANMVCRSNIEDFMADKLLAVQHYNTLNNTISYCRNPKSQAFVDENDYSTYCFGAIQGASPTLFFNMCKDINNMIEIDRRNHVMPQFHDESYFNRYIVSHKNLFTIFPPEYCFPAHWKTTKYENKITCLDKDVVLNRLFGGLQ